MAQRSRSLRRSLAIIKKHFRNNWHSKRRQRLATLSRPGPFDEWLAAFPEKELRRIDAERMAREEVLYILQKVGPEKDLQYGLGARNIMEFVGRPNPLSTKTNIPKADLIVTDRPYKRKNRS